MDLSCKPVSPSLRGTLDLFGRPIFGTGARISIPMSKVSAQENI